MCSIADRSMAGTINYLAPVDNASGKIFGKKEKFVAVTRNWGNRRRGCSTTGKRNLKDHLLVKRRKTIKLSSLLWQQ